MAPRLRFADKDRSKLLRCYQPRKAFLRSYSVPLREPELIRLIKQAPVSSSVPKTMFERRMAGQDRSQMCPNQSTLKVFARRLGIPPSNTSRPHTGSKPFYSKTDGFVDGDRGDASDVVDGEGDDDDNLGPGPLFGRLEDDFFPT